MDARKELLIKMYEQMLNDINRHIMVVWQSIGVLIGAFAIFALVEKNIVSLDLATAIILLLSSWLIAHLLDASYWYNRNLVIIANIERQFLLQDDLKNIHCYFGEHRKKNKMIDHLRIQFALGVTLAALVLTYHFFERVAPGFSAPLGNFDPTRALPYLLSGASAWYLFRFKNKTKDKYDMFLKNSPGIPINISEIDYSIGHGQ